MPAPQPTTAVDVVTAWAASGAMALSGRSGAEPLGPPARLVEGILAAGATIASRSAALGKPVELDWLALLGERAALAGLSRAGPISCGGSTRLVAASDGWIALALARDDDVDLVPAWLGLDGVPEDPWPAVERTVGDRRQGELLDRAALLGLPVSSLGERSPRPNGAVEAISLGGAPSVPALEGLVVADLSALWAGPLCASILRLAGAQVVKVESVSRPDGARRAGDGFFELLNAGKRNLVLDLHVAAGRDALRQVIAAADVVVESSRPRALEQLGILATDVLTAMSGPRVWVSITGHGRSSPRVAFGDDAAVAGGLVVEDESGPCFCADAVADPAAGMFAAAAALDALATGGRWLLDVAMAGVSAELAGPTLPTNGVTAAPPRARSLPAQ